MPALRPELPCRPPFCKYCLYCLVMSLFQFNGHLHRGRTVTSISSSMGFRKELSSMNPCLSSSSILTAKYRPVGLSCLEGAPVCSAPPCNLLSISSFLVSLAFDPAPYSLKQRHAPWRDVFSTLYSKPYHSCCFCIVSYNSYHWSVHRPSFLLISPLKINSRKKYCIGRVVSLFY